MSWDLYLLPPDHGQNPGEWLEQAADEGQDVDVACQHAEAVVARRPELQIGGPFGDGYQLTPPEASGFPLDVGLYGNHASISVAYWELGDRTADLGKLVQEIVDVVSDETGWVAYDPQEDRLVRSDEIARLFGSGHAHGAEIVTEMKRSDAPKKKRIFGLL